jgi:VCBS repeat-containing protein
MASMTFVINDTSTGSTDPLVEVTITENADGTLTFTVTQLTSNGAYLGDLRGLFFDVTDETLIGTLSAAPTSLLTEFQQGNDTVRNLGQGVNMQGLLGSDGGYDVGIEIGTQGIGANDVRSFSFTLDSSLCDLTLDDFATVDFGLRIASVGQDTNGDGIIDTSRTLASRTGETTFDPITVQNDTTTVFEDGSATGNVLANDAGLGTKVLLSVSYGVTTYSFADNNPVIIAIAAGASLTIYANGNYSIDASAADSLAEGQPAISAISYVAQQTIDGDTATDEGQLTVTITGTNDAPVVVALLGDSAGSTNPLAETNTGLLAAGTLTVTDVDLSDTVAMSVYAVSTTGPTDGLSNADLLSYFSVAPGSLGADPGTLSNLSWNFNSGSQAFDFLAKDELLTLHYTVRATDDSGAGNNIGDGVVTIHIKGTNDAPVITDGTTSGVVQEDVNNQAIGDLNAFDPDNGAQQFWTVADGVPAGNADYHFVMDSLTITKNGSPLFFDDFLDGAAPPNAPPFPGGAPASYSAPPGAFTESSGKLHIDSDNAASNFNVGAGNADPIVGQTATLRTNIDPSNLTNGLKSNSSFVVSGVFDLILPDNVLEGYAIRLSDRHIGGNGTPPDQRGDNVVSLGVRMDENGLLVVSLTAIDFVHDTRTILESIALAPPMGVDQIRLNLSHSEANTGVVDASFDYLSGGAVVDSQTFSATGLIFQGENWVRAEIRSSAPAINDSAFGGTYGQMNIDQAGAWTYTLDNSKASTQSLANGQTATDTLTVQVADQYGAFDTRTINIDVIGTNDAPIMQTGPVSRLLTEDAGINGLGNLTATGLATFSDVDLTDTHTPSATLQSSVLSGGGSLPAGLLALLNGALTPTLIESSTGDSNGTLQWNFALANSAAQFLAQGQSLTLVYNIDVTDPFGATATQAVTVTVTGTNDAPIITGGSTIGSVQEDGVLHAAGTLAATDADHGATRTWTVVGGSSPTLTADYHFQIDNFQVFRNGSSFYSDEFGNNVPPPAGGLFSNGTAGTYSIGPTNTVTESGGRVNMDGAFGTPFAIGTGLGHFITLNTTTSNNPADLGSGLKIDDNITVEGRFDLVLPDIGESYRIRLSDSLGPTLGDDTIQLSVTRDALGVLRVQMSELDFVADVSTFISSTVLNPAAGDDQLVLRLSHFASDPGKVFGSFDLLDNGVVTSSGSVSGFGQIFGTETPGDLSDDELWTRAAFGAGDNFAIKSALNGDYGTLTVNQNGDWTYDLANGQANVQALAQSETVTDKFQVQVIDQFGAFDTETVNITVNGTNDAPQITGTTAGAVQEDGPLSATGTLNATDVDHGATRTWSVVGGSTPNLADYHVQIDNFHVDRNGLTFFDDPFSDNNQPPSAPPIINGNPTSYSVGTATLTEAGGRAIMDGANGGSFAIGTGVGHFVALNTNTSNNPGDLGLGLKNDDDFTVEGRFDLIVPDFNQNYGIRVTDNTGPGHPGDDVIQLIVLRNAGPGGALQLGLSRIDFVHSTVSGISGLPIAPAPADDQILLRLSHQASNPGVITASYQLLDNGVVTSSGNLSGFGQIFGTRTPGDTSDDELYTRAQFVAGEAISPISTLNGQYGSLSVNQNGTWTYNLANGQANVQALAAGQTVFDTFQVQVTDQFGAFDTETVTVTVTGTNDAPLAIADTLSATEDTLVTYTAAQLLGNDTDVDNLNSQLSIGSVSSGAGGTAVLNGDGTVTFTPNLNFNGAASFSYTATDGAALSNSATVIVNVAAVNDAPVIQAPAGGGGFAPAVNTGVAVPNFVTIADFSNDNKLDLAVSNFFPGGHTVSILLGDGAGNFGAPTSFNVGISPNASSAGDLNGDGNLDLVVVNQDSANVSILLGNGNGTFLPQTTLSAQNPTSVAIADFNNDGKRDLVVAMSIGNQMSLFLGNGNGTFQGATALAAGHHYGQVVVGDVNGDGQADLVAAVHSGAPRVSVLLGNGNGTFAAPAQFSTGAVGAAVSLALGDLDGDGDLDIAAANTSALGVAVLLNNGAGAFGTLATYGNVSPPNNTQTVVIGEFTGAGAPDIAVANPALGGVSLLAGNGNGTFQPELFMPTGAGASALATHDLNTDGTPDLVVTNLGAQNVSVLLGLGGNTTTDEETPLTLNTISISDVDAGSDPMQVTLAVGHGALTLGSTVGLSGDLIGDDGALSFTGSQDEINAALASGLTYTPALNYNGSDTLSITADDLGHNPAPAQSTTELINLTINGTNDAPVITGGATSGAVQEDTINTATGQLDVSDPDNGATQTWTAQGGTQSANADFLFAADSLRITKNGNGAFFFDDFLDGISPPSVPTQVIVPPQTNPSATTYGGSGVSGLTESGGRIFFDSDNAVPFIGVGTADPFIGLNAIPRTNIDPANLAAGLKNDDNFTVTGVFDLILPDSPRETYGIRLTDRLIGGGGTPPDQQGDDMIELVVRMNQAGNLVVALREIDFVADVTTNIQSIALAPPVGADQIRLNLTHSTANTGALVASFEYLAGGVAVGTQTFSQIGRIFGTETPGFTGDDEVWTRAEIVAYSPAQSDSILSGVYGTLNVNQGGDWTYNLDNTRVATQNLAKGQSATDTFIIQVMDQFGTFDTETITINVAGRNDAPVIPTPSTSRTLAEDSNDPNLTATGLATFFDIDLTDAHTAGAVLQSATLSTGGGLPTGLSASLINAVSTAILDPSTIDGSGQLQWDFSLANSGVQFLAAGQTLTATYLVNVVDTFGATATQTVTINVTGADDFAPMSVSNFTSLIYLGANPAGHGVANDINNAGQIVGFSQTYDAGSIQGYDGWIYDNGLFTTVHIGNQNSVSDINNFGVLAGFYSPNNSTPRYGFIQDSLTTTTIDLTPNISTTVDGINDAVNFVGSSYLHAGNIYSGFASIGGVITYLNPFGSNDAHANGINNANDIVGSYSLGGVAHSYLDHNGVFTNVDNPGAIQTIAVDINNAGQMVGFYQDGASQWHGFINTGGVFTTVDNPLGVGAGGTQVLGINDAGQLVGTYYDGANIPHAFVATIDNPINQSTNDVLVANLAGGSLFGGAGDDTFVFNAPPQTQSVITDFVHGQDVLQISAAGFDHGLISGAILTVLTGAPAGVLGGVNGYFFFDDSNPAGATLYWDASGGSGVDATAVATLQGVTTLVSSDFHLL